MQFGDKMDLNTSYMQGSYYDGYEDIDIVIKHIPFLE